MSSPNLTVDLKSKIDRKKKQYYVGKIKFPGDIDCREGVTFLIFTSDEGYEQMQITKLVDERPENDRHE